MKKEREKYRLNVEREGERLKRSRAQDVEECTCKRENRGDMLIQICHACSTLRYSQVIHLMKTFWSTWLCKHLIISYFMLPYHSANSLS